MKKTIVAASMIALFGLSLCMNTAAKADSDTLHPLCKAHGDVAQAAMENRQRGIPLDDSLSMSSVDKSGMSSDIVIMAYGKSVSPEPLQDQVVAAFKDQVITECQSILAPKKKHSWVTEKGLVL